MKEDLSALAWVSDEVRRSLESALSSLRRCLKEVEAATASDLDSIDPSLLRQVRAQIHQSVGALELVGMGHAAQPLRATEAAVHRLSAKPALITPAAVKTIERCAHALLDFLSRKLAGKTVSPLSMFPQYRAVQELAGAARAHPADLWVHEWRWRALPPEGFPAAAPTASDATAIGQFEIEMLSVMRNVPGAAQRLCALCDGLAAGVDGHLRALWQLAAAFFEAQTDGLLGFDLHARRVASRLLAQLRAGERGQASDRLAQDLLFFCAQVAPSGQQPAGPRLDAVRKLYGLDDETPVDYQDSPLGQFDPALLTQARKRVAAAKEVWSAVASGELARLPGLSEPFTLVGDSLNRLYPEGAAMARALLAVVAHCQSPAAAPSPELAMEVATAMLFLEASLEDGDFSHPDMPQRVARLAERLDRVRQGQDPGALERWMEELYRQVSDRQTMGNVVQELRSALSEVEKQIDQYFRDPSQRELLIPVPAQLSAMRGVLSLLDLQHASQAVVRMRDDVDALASTEVDPERAAQTGTFDRLADNLGALSFLIDMVNVQPQAARSLFKFDPDTGMLQAMMHRAARPSGFGAFDSPANAGTGQPALLERAQNLVEAAARPEADHEQIERALEVLSQEAKAADQADLAALTAQAQTRLASATDADDVEAVRRQLTESIQAIASTSEPPPEPAEPLRPVPPPGPPAAPGQTGLEDDTEMREIFLEEAREVVGMAREGLEALRHHPDDLAAMTVVRRAFHTLKGSARMVGLRDFGEAAWACEQLFNVRLADSMPADADLRGFSGEALDHFERWIDAIESNTAGGFDPQVVIHPADAMRLEQRRLPLGLPTPALLSEPIAEPIAKPLVSDWADLPDLPDLSGAAAPAELRADEGPGAEPPVSDLHFHIPDLPSAADLDLRSAAPAMPTETSTDDESFELLDLPDLQDEPAAMASTVPADRSLLPEPMPGLVDETPSMDGELLTLDLDDLAIASPAAEPLDASAPEPGFDRPAQPEVTESFELDLSALEGAIPTGSSRIVAPEGWDGALDVAPLADPFAAPQSDRSPEPTSPQSAPDREAIELDFGFEPTPEVAPTDLEVPVAVEAASEPEDSGPMLLDDADLDDEVTEPNLDEARQPVPAVALAEPIDQPDLSADSDFGTGTPVEAIGETPGELIEEGFDEEHEPVKVIGDLQVSIPLFNIFLNEADELSRHLCTDLAEWLHELHRAPGETSVVLAHSLAGNCATVGYLGASQLARSLEHALVRANGRSYGEAEEAELFNAAAEEIRRLLHQFAAGFLVAPDSELMRRLADLEHAPLGDVDVRPPDLVFGEPLVEAADLVQGTETDVPVGSPGEDESPETVDPADDFELAMPDFGPSTGAADVQPSTAPADVSSLADLPLAPMPDSATETDASGGSEAPAEPGAEALDSGAPEPEPVAATEPEPVLQAVEGVFEQLGQPALMPFLAPAQAAQPEIPASADARVEVQALNLEDDIDVEDALDPELFPIFDEEASELLPQLQSRLREWSQHPADEAAASACMRTLHTVKGGARLAGAMRLGEMAHRLETAIAQLRASGAADAAAVERLSGHADTLEGRLEALRRVALDAPAAEVGAADSSDVPALPVSDPAPPVATVQGSATVASVVASTDETTNEPPEEPASAWVPPSAAPAMQRMAIDWSRFASAPDSAPSHVPAASAASSQTAVVRVRAPLLDRLVNHAGEVSITRSRIEADVAQMKNVLGDLTDNLERLRSQLRDIELQAETQIDTRMEAARAAAEQFDPLEMDRFTRFQELTRMMAESVNDVATVQRGLRRTLQSAEDDLAQQARLTRDLQDDLLRTRMVEFDGLSERLYRVVRQAAKETGKQVRLDITGGSIEIDRGVLDRMTGAFEHLLRNSVVHGIESPAQRSVLGKEAIGQITIGVTQEGNEVAIDFRDDGAGLDLARIREKAQAAGLLGEGAQPSEADLAALIFQAGFTTADHVTGLAGRGVGMDVVRSDVAAMGGRIETATAAAQGTSFRLVLPLTTAVTQVVMMRCGELTVAVPSTLIEIVRRVPAEELLGLYERGIYIHNAAELPFYWLAALLQGTSHGVAGSGRTVPVVIIRSAAQRIAVHVDEVLGNQEVVVKNLGPQLSHLPGLAGMTLLPSGLPALIYNPVALATLYGQAARAATLVALGQARHLAEHPAEAAPVDRPPLVLVVDDSLTVRRVTQRLLVREGYRVAVAKDGLEGLERLAEELPAVVLTDIEMPRMDGFDLVRNMRMDARLTRLPIVMITSRIAQKHRDYAAELGVDHYLGKPYVEEDLLALVARYAGRLAPA